MTLKKACVLCSGCPESRFDSAKVQNFLVENGWDITHNQEEADLIVFRACGLTNVAINQSISSIKYLKLNKKQNARLIVWGCLPKIGQEALRSVYDDISFGEDNVDLFNEILEAKKPLEQVSVNSVLPVFRLKSSGFRGVLSQIMAYFSKKFSIVGNDKIYVIKVSTGCLDNCSFCSVKKSRGHICSKPVEDIILDFKRGLNNGYTHFGFLATDLGAYGKDIGCNLADLLSELIKIEGSYKIALRNINPYHLNEMFDELKPIFESGKIWFLSSALESGSDRILKLMCRRYTVAQFADCFNFLNKKHPNIFLRTQLLVGFPTETEEDFKKTMKILDKIYFDWVEIYEYSPTIGTLAASMNGQISNKTKRHRSNQLYKKTLFSHINKKIKNLIKFSL